MILEGIGQSDLETLKSQKLNERDYGSLSGLNKDDARKKWGEEQVHIWRRSYDVPPPDGESLKMTAERVLPYWESDIKPRLVKGEKVFIAAHGNSMRALIMELEGLSGEEIGKLWFSAYCAHTDEFYSGQGTCYRCANRLQARQVRELCIEGDSRLCTYSNSPYLGPADTSRMPRNEAFRSPTQHSDLH